MAEKETGGTFTREVPAPATAPPSTPSKPEWMDGRAASRADGAAISGKTKGKVT